MIQTIDFKDWIRPSLFGGILVVGYAIRGSDQPAAALLIAAMLAFYCAIVWVLPVRETPSILKRSENWLLAPLAISLLLSIVIGKIALDAKGLGDSSFYVELIKLFAVAAAFLIGYRLSLNDSAARRLLDAVIVIGTLWAGIAIAMHILDPSGVYGVRKMAAGRLTGALSSANSAATLFGALTLLSFARLVSRLDTTNLKHMIDSFSPLYAGCAVICFAALSLTLSRTGIAVTLICVVIALLFARGRPLTLVSGLMALGGVLVFGTLLFATPLTVSLDRLMNVERDAEVRQVINDSHLNAALQNPLLGHGLGSFNAVNNAVVTQDNYRDLSVIQAAHNVYIQWLGETGLIGLTLFVTLNLTLIAIMAFAIRHKGRMANRLWGVLLVCGLFLVHGLTDYAFQEPALTPLIASLMGMGFAVATNSRG